MPNFFEEQRNRLGLTRTEIAARLHTTAESVRLWEIDRVVPSPPIAELATGYEVSEARMERQVMAVRRRIEARKLSLQQAGAAADADE